MDISTFYAVTAATCFTLVGLWWSVVKSKSVNESFLTFKAPFKRSTVNDSVNLEAIYTAAGGLMTPCRLRLFGH